MNYPLLKKSLDLKSAIAWMPTDSLDDFFPDPVDWQDIRQFQEEFITNRDHRILQVDALPHVTEFVPKKSGMLREAIWLHPCHRILYLSILHRLMPRLDSKLCAEVYSYRADNSSDPNSYPFERKMDRWKDYHNDFRRAALESTSGAVLVTDLASYFDHIQIEQLGHRIKSILAGTLDDGDREAIDFLMRLLKIWGHDGFGMPHNLDSSSFFGSVYLHNVDKEMIASRYRYFRWADDIKIVSKSREEALQALHDLQRALAQHRLFLATDKTHIHERDSEEFSLLLNVDDDILISQAEETISRGAKDELEAITDKLFKRLEFHSSVKGDERKFRALANRLLNISDFVEVQREITPRIHEFVIPRLKSHPERTDYWTKMLSAQPSVKVADITRELLVERPSLFDWQRFHLWKLATQLPTELVPKNLFDKAKEESASTLSENVASQSIVFLGRHSDNTERENLYARLFTAQRSYVVQRAVLIAIQELPDKDYYYRRVLERNSDHAELIKYLSHCDSPDYGLKPRSARHCLKEPRVIEHVIKRGIGLAQNRATTFRLGGYDYDY
jgi:hypothetical protein